jgi:peptide/nickel transport system permease protein
MFRTIARRLVTGAIALVILTALVFSLVQLAPGSPFAESEDAGLARMPPDAQAELERLYHLDRPLPVQYALWLGSVLRGDLGVSFRDRRPVLVKVRERVGTTVSLNLAALSLAVVLAVPLGAIAAWRPGSWVDRAIALSSYVIDSVPAFCGALLLQIVFAVHLGWLPLAGVTGEAAAGAGPLAALADRVRHLVLPTVCLSYGSLAFLSRFVRATLLENASHETTLAARARGVSRLSAFVRHGFRLASIPMLTLAGLLLPALVSGSVLIESIFAVPGLGRLFVDAALQRDLPVILGLTLLAGIATLVAIIASDIAYALADPRLRRA